MDKTYKLLKVAAIIFKVLSWASLVIGFISGIVIFIGGGTPETPKVTGFLGILLGIVYFFISFTTSEVITLLLDIHGKLQKGPNT